MLNFVIMNDLHLMFNFRDRKSIISVLNFPQLTFSAVHCSNPLLHKETLNAGFAPFQFLTSVIILSVNMHEAN
jgi:hypothetical protein